MTNQTTQTNQKNSMAAQRPLRTKGVTKNTQLITMLSRKSGADVGAINAKFGWQPHTTRAALSGLRKAGFVVVKNNAGPDKQTRYRIEAAPEAQTAGGISDDN